MRSLRTVLFWLHLICGIAVGLVVFIMSITGVALTYEKQMLHWADGFVITAPSAQAERMSPEALLQHAHTELGRVPTALELRADPSEPVRLRFGRESVAVDPYTGAELGEGAAGLRKFFRQMILWHRWLGQEGEGRAAAKAITGACNLGFLFIVISGAYLWLPKQWTWQHLRSIVWFRGGLVGKARDFNWHNVIGLWMVLPLVFIISTATFFSYSWPGKLLYAITGEEPPQRSGGGSEAAQAEPLPPAVLYAGLDGLVTKAAAVEPGWRKLTLTVPDKPAGAVSFAFDKGDWGTVPDLRSTVVLDRETGRLVRRETLADQQRARQARSWIRFIHTGEAFGWLGQTIAGLASLGACFLVYTGWALSWRRFVAWRRRRTAS